MIHPLLEKGKSYLLKFVTFFLAQSLIKKVFIVAGLISTFFICFFLFLVFLVWSGALGRLPDKETLRLVENPAATEVYSADSVLLGRYFIQERSNIPYEHIPKTLEDALLATEDIRFYDHHGVDVRSLFRVLVKSLLLRQESSGGGSTITQQLAKNLYPRREYVFFSLTINKIREILTAWRFENVYDKKALLTLYLNTVPFGDNTYGIEAAAQRFFSIPARKLSAPQAAVLIGMLKATYAYNPRLFPARALQRRNVVLAQMAKYNMLSAVEVEKSQALPLKLNYNKITHHSGLAPYFREYIRPQLLEWCSAHNKNSGKPFNLYTDGLKVYTTIDSRLQRYAEDAVNRQMAHLQQKFLQHWNKTEPWHAQPAILKDALQRSERYRKLKDRKLSEAEIKKVMETPVMMSVFSWKGEQEKKMSPLDSIKYYLKFLNAGLVAIDPRQGAVRAWVGGINHHYFQYDHVRQSTKRQVGSTFKPIVYAAALERGVRPCDFISAEKTVYLNAGNLKEWSPQNSEDNYGLKYSMEGALANSVNTVSVRLLEMAGVQNTIALAKKMGIESYMPAVPSLALGVADISMIEMAKAYTAFVNQGKVVEPFYITSITTHEGNVLEQFKPHQPIQALSQESAQIMLHMLQRTVNEGTASSLRWQYGLANDVGGKTGTTQSNADGWFMAVTPRLVIGAWVGADDPRIRFRSTALGQGASTALPLVAKFLQKINSDKTLKGLSQVRFPALSPSLEDDLSCALFKSDTTLLEKIFGKREKESRRTFGADGKSRSYGNGAKKKGGLFKRLFGKNR